MLSFNFIGSVSTWPGHPQNRNHGPVIVAWNICVVRRHLYNVDFSLHRQHFTFSAVSLCYSG